MKLEHMKTCHSIFTMLSYFCCCSAFRYIQWSLQPGLLHYQPNAPHIELNLVAENMVILKRLPEVDRVSVATYKVTMKLKKLKTGEVILTILLFFPVCRNSPKHLKQIHIRFKTSQNILHTLIQQNCQLNRQVINSKCLGIPCITIFSTS